MWIVGRPIYNWIQIRHQGRSRDCQGGNLFGMPRRLCSAVFLDKGEICLSADFERALAIWRTIIRICSCSPSSTFRSLNLLSEPSSQSAAQEDDIPRYWARYSKEILTLYAKPLFTVVSIQILPLRIAFIP